MSLFSALQQDEPDLSDADVAEALEQVKKTARTNRLVVVAPVLFVAALAATFVAAPPKYGELLVTEAEASDELPLPRVFGANGVWNFAEPIATLPAPAAGPASMVEAPVEPLVPSYVLVPPSSSPPASSSLQSFPVSASTPPSPTPEQSADLDPDGLSLPSTVDWSRFTPVIRVEPPVVAADEGTATADTSSVASSQAVNAGIPGEVFPSLSPQGTSSDTSQPASVVPVSVLVHNAHVTVRVQVVDEDSSSIDSCQTYVDWGDGQLSAMVTADASAECSPACTELTESNAVGINAELLFEHEYAGTIDAEPRVYVASGDGCSFQLAELELPPIAIVPW